MKTSRLNATKAKQIAASLVLAACASDTPLGNLSRMAARLTEREWISLSFAAGVAVADVSCRIMVIAILEKLA